MNSNLSIRTVTKYDRLAGCLLVFFLLVTCVSYSQQSPVFVLNSESFGKLPKGECQYYIEEEGESLEPRELAGKPFITVNQQVLNLDFVNTPVWVKLEVSNQSEYSGFILDFANPLMDSLDLYVGGSWADLSLSGKTREYQAGDKTHPQTLIPFELEPGASAILLLRVSSNTPIVTPINIVPANDSAGTLSAWSFTKGIFYGLMLVMFLYNFVIAIITRYRAYIYYTSYVFFITLAQSVLDGYFQLIFSGLSYNTSKNLVLVFSVFTGISALQFVKDFLDVKKFSKALYRGAHILQVLYLTAIVLQVFGWYQGAYRTVDVMGLTASLYALSIAIFIAFKGYRPAYFFLIAWTLFLTAMVIFVLKNVGVIDYSAFSSNILQIGIATEVVLISVALADRINTLRQETQRSQAEALRVSQENEKIIREQNVVLEQKVSERTLELQEANEELTVTLSNLKETQMQLVDAEKMASLGQLTAGIAHEINNPINFVTSNINPLKRDIQDMYEIVEKYATIPGSEVESVKEAHALREELDYDYLKEEIESLVNGIEEGATRTSEIVKGLRTFSRLDEDAIKLADVGEGISNTLVLLNSKMEDRIEIVREMDPDVPQIECFPGKLNQVFMNILNNAIYAVQHKHYAEGESPIITIRTYLEDDKANISIKDNGIGMDEKTRKKIYDPFFTTKDVGEGTGLGMSIVYTIIEKHRGTLTLHSELGVGTEFIITLPLRQPNEFE